MICQRCRLPLAAHKSLTQLNQNQLRVLKANETEAATTPSTVYGGNGEDTSFILLSESIAGPNPLWSSKSQDLSSGTQEEKLENLFDFLSAKTDINMPICSECAETVRSTLKQQYDDTCAERDTYFSFLNRIKDEPQPESAEVEAIAKQIRKLEEENAAAIRELHDAEAELVAAEKELENSRVKAAELAERNKQIYDERNAAELEFRKMETEKNRLEAISQYQAMQLQRLQRTNVYNDVFCIGIDGQIATINGLRLGRLKEKKFDWAEINAAWGQTLLLLTAVISRLNISIPEYKLRPLGSMSRIDKVEFDDSGQPTGKTTSLELYSKGDTAFTRILMPSKMDAAMVALLDVLKQVGQAVEKENPDLHIPYYVDKDVIGGYSIIYSSTSHKEWTQACRYVLTDCRWILSYVSSK